MQTHTLDNDGVWILRDGDAEFLVVHGASDATAHALEFTFVDDLVRLLRGLIFDADNLRVAERLYDRVCGAIQHDYLRTHDEPLRRLASAFAPWGYLRLVKQTHATRPLVSHTSPESPGTTPPPNIEGTQRNSSFSYRAWWSVLSPEHRAPADAVPFGPPARLESGELPPECGFSVTKDVLYVPVIRRHESERFPTLELRITLRPSDAKDAATSAGRGARVSVQVRNVWNGSTNRSLVLQGELDGHLVCRIPVTPETVSGWLGPNGPLNARLNENLVDAHFEVEGCGAQGAALRGQTENRVFLYRRKVLVFVPGVFGSQLKVTTPDGRTLGFPDFYKEPDMRSSGLERIIAGLTPSAEAAKDLITQVGANSQASNTTVSGVLSALTPLGKVAQCVFDALNQEVGGLECDADGEPLLRPVQPQLLRLGGRVYDVDNDFRRAVDTRWGQRVGGFRLFELRVFAYDWRLDLTESAKALVKELDDLQGGRGADSLLDDVDTDCSAVVLGHSTGGLVLKRALAEDSANDLISHAFFINTPFRGCPKALSVLLTGEDPPGGRRMVPFVKPNSLRSVALSMPVVYHLVPSLRFAGCAASVESDKPPPRDREEEKRQLVTQAIAHGLIPPPMAVAPGLPAGTKATIAAGADAWHAFWNHIHHRPTDTLHRILKIASRDPSRPAAWLNDEIDRRGLRHQWEARIPGGWSALLAERARTFHEICESVGSSPCWQGRTFVFYSITDTPTTECVRLRPSNDRTNEWRLSADRELRAGDGTIPTSSQKAAGPAATVFRALPRDGAAGISNPVGETSGPVHSVAPKVDWLWDRVFDVLLGTLDPKDVEHEPTLANESQLAA